MGRYGTPKDSVMTGSDSYQKFTVLDEEIEVYLRITKVDEETGKPVLLPDTAFQIYWLDEQGHYRYDSNGNPKLVTMTDTVNGHLTKDVDTFYTNSEGILTLPEKLPLGKYRIVEVTGPNGFYNEWLDSAGYENGILTDDADGIYYVDFEITTDRIYAATGDKNENGMDTLVIGENYSNHETLGKLTIRKTGEVLAGWKTEAGALDPWMTGEAEDGNFVYETRPLAGAEYTITAAEDIYTQDRQTDNYGNRTLWYAKGDVVAVVTTGDGSADIAAFAPARTKATYDFLSVIHDGTIGEVSVTLPLGSYHIEETKPPYGYIGTTESYDVTFAWDNELNDVVMATSIAKVDGAASSQSFEIVRSKDANADFTEQQTLKFHNDREKAKVGVYKVDRETGKYLSGAVFNLYAADDIYSVDGKLLFAAGELVATSPETGADGYTYFDCDIPIRGEYYGSSIRKDATTNSGNYIVKELRAPLGYYVNEEPMKVTFTYDGQAIMVLDNTCANKPTEMWVSKRDLTNDEELPGATLAIKDTDGNTVTTWVSTDEPHRVTGLHFGESYTLTEIRAADGYALADNITFRLIQKSDRDGNPLEECEVYYLTTKNILFWKWDDWKLLDDATVIMQDDITKVQISKKDLTTNEELPGAELIITDEKGSEIDRWISTAAPHYMEKLPAGKYTLTEVTAPDGYAIAERMEFEEYYRQLHRMPTEMQQEYRQENAPAKPKWQPTELQPIVRRARYLGKLPRRYPKVSGFMACYYHYCALLRKAYHGKATKRCYFLLREDFLLFSRYQQQTKFLWENHIETMDELLAYKESAEVQIQQLARQRKVLYRQKREPERAAREEKIKSLTQQMKALRHEVYICSDIETDAAEVQEKLRQAELAAQEERNEVKQDEQRRRSSRSDGAGSLTGYRGGY